MKLLNPLHELSRNGLNDLKEKAAASKAKQSQALVSRLTEASHDFPLVARSHAPLKAQASTTYKAYIFSRPTPASHHEKRSPSVAKVVTTSGQLSPYHPNIRHALRNGHRCALRPGTHPADHRHKGSQRRSRSAHIPGPPSGVATETLKGLRRIFGPHPAMAVPFPRGGRLRNPSGSCPPTSQHGWPVQQDTECTSRGLFGMIFTCHKAARLPPGDMITIAVEWLQLTCSHPCPS